MSTIVLKCRSLMHSDDAIEIRDGYPGKNMALHAQNHAGSLSS